MKKHNALSEFSCRVYAIVSLISHGETRTYKEVAANTGRQKAWRAVESILNGFYFA
ncbi:MAG: hypothetical protein G01um101429_292 [Parcubacteria group bacterium Gr01-1014_29]|nr:MAG: hypothetical protein G01um101429_292 [Parcubacteria group bacterium Gr01-1014_29]